MYFKQYGSRKVSYNSDFVRITASSVLKVALLAWNSVTLTLFGFIFYLDTIPFYVNISQKNDRNTSDHIFIKDMPITFTVHIHDPSHYLNNSAISYHLNYGDGSGLFVTNSSISTHTYKLIGNFSLGLSVQAMIPGPCSPVTPPAPLPTSPGKSLWLRADGNKLINDASS